MTASDLILIAGSLLSLGFTYIPGLREKFAVQTDATKQLTMLALLVLVAFALVGLSCANVVDLPFVSNVTCDRAGISDTIVALVLGIMSNQGTDRIFPKPESVKAVRKAADAQRGTENE